MTEHHFNAWWHVYPRKVGKAVAQKAYEKALKKIAAPDLLEKTRQYAFAMQNKDKQYIPHPSTWLNQERYNDPLEDAAPLDQKTMRRVNGFRHWTEGLTPAQIKECEELRMRGKFQASEERRREFLGL